MVKDDVTKLMGLSEPALRRIIVAVQFCSDEMLKRGFDKLLRMRLKIDKKRANSAQLMKESWEHRKELSDKRFNCMELFNSEFPPEFSEVLDEKITQAGLEEINPENIGNIEGYN